MKYAIINYNNNFEMESHRGGVFFAKRARQTSEIKAIY